MVNRFCLRLHNAFAFQSTYASIPNKGPSSLNDWRRANDKMRGTGNGAFRRSRSAKASLWLGDSRPRWSGGLRTSANNPKCVRLVNVRLFRLTDPFVPGRPKTIAKLEGLERRRPCYCLSLPGSQSSAVVSNRSTKRAVNQNISSLVALSHLIAGQQIRQDREDNYGSIKVTEARS